MEVRAISLPVIPPTTWLKREAIALILDAFQLSTRFYASLCNHTLPLTLLSSHSSPSISLTCLCVLTFPPHSVPDHNFLHFLQGFQNLMVSLTSHSAPSFWYPILGTLYQQYFDQRNLIMLLPTHKVEGEIWTLMMSWCPLFCFFFILVYIFVSSFTVPCYSLSAL